MFEETIKLEILKHEKRIEEVKSNIQTITDKVLKERNLDGNIILKIENYKSELKILGEYIVVLTFGLAYYKMSDFLDKISVVKNSANHQVQDCQKIMDKIYAKYPENGEKNGDNLSKIECDLICKEIELLQEVIDKQELAKARYRTALLVSNIYQNET